MRWPQERFLDHARIGKFVGQRSRTIRAFREQVFDYPRVTPAEQAVEIAEFFVKIVVAFGSDLHDVERDARRLPNHLGERTDFRVRPDPLAVLDSVFQERPRDRAIGKYAGDHQRPEEIALSAFVDAKMRLEHFRRMHFLITEPRFAENLRLQFETNEILDPLALQEHLGPLLVNRDAQFILLREKKRVGFRRKIETGVIEQLPERLNLIAGEGRGVRC